MVKTKKTNKIKNAIKITSVVLAGCLATSVFMVSMPTKANNNDSAQSLITKVETNKIDTGVKNYFDENVVYQVPQGESDEREISVIVTMGTQTLLSSYQESKDQGEFAEFVTTREAIKVANQTVRESNKLINTLSNHDIDFTIGERYDTVISGFEITIKASDFKQVNNLLGRKATLIIGEEYEPAQTQVVTNEVDVYETGIFDSSSSKYQGDGVVVAVLDTGLDYTHSAFSTDNYNPQTLAFTLESVSNTVSQTTAATFTSGLSGEDVYLNERVPYAYDYADKDPDVLPINSEHGTHVAGIISSSDNTITGVAPNAQLAIMKVFSDSQNGAKTSWLMAALEDCVTLGVDVINMSLGSSCGFAREVDKENVNIVYDSIKAAGISLICAASNDYNATFGSEKNGNLGLTSNPDSGTVGSPSTYDAALSVASVGGVKTPYLLNGDQIIYFNESTDSSAKQRNFVDDLLRRANVSEESKTFDYVVIPGIGRISDYYEQPEFYQGKIVLVKRGDTTFEEKIRVAMQMGASGIIIYNNVSGTISMSIGQNADAAACSISQEDGEKLVAAVDKTTAMGQLKVSRSQLAGPFMSEFSSWGPTSDLQIKPEITSHGGDILSAVPGHDYDRLSGTSMAAPNLAGAAALIRQYVKYSGVFGDDLTTQEITALVNQVMMSTSDILLNKNGLPYAVRKQGSGLININKATSTTTYVATFDKNGNEMDKTKLELGDDKERKGVYDMTFAINNVGEKAVTYAVDALVQTEGVSSIYTSHSDRTVTQDGYKLGGKTTVNSVTGGTQDGNNVTVQAHSTATVTIQLVLTDEDKKYLNESFEHGMYVEGFVTLTQTGEGTNMNVPFLAFYGDWTEAPIFDEEYYDTNKDELNDGISPDDKLMPDAYATRIIGGLYSDYIATLGEYYFKQDPQATKIAANKEHISLSNQKDGNSSTLNSIRDIYAGLLRNCKEVDISIIEVSTGKEIYKRTNYNQYKSHNGGGSIYASAIEVEFDVLEHNLKNNTQYNVIIEAYIDYGTRADQKNVRNTFEFPLYIDFQAPVVTDVNFRTEYDRTTKKTSLFADVNVYDNHYAMAMQVGQITASESPDYLFSLSTFGKYITPVHSSFNSTSVVTIELTDYISQLKNSLTIDYNSSTNTKETNSFLAIVYDYAMNSAYYEIELPDDILAMYFAEEEKTLSANETLDLSTVLTVFPESSWIETLDFTSSDESVAAVVNQTVIAKAKGNATITAIGKNAKGEEVTATLKLNVLGKGDPGFVEYSTPEVNRFEVTGYTTLKAFYSTSSDEREIGFTDGTYEFGNALKLSMFPSESVELKYVLDSYFPDNVSVSYRVGNSKIAKVNDMGVLVALEKGSTKLTVTVMFDGKATLYRSTIDITVKDPYTINSIYLMSYRGLGGEVIIPADRGITTIYPYAFSLYEYVDKDVEAGDVIDEEDPYFIKQQFIGENTIKKIVIPEGVKEIQEYAFAGLTGLEEVVLPSTLNKIGAHAFYGCTSLTKINLDKVEFINRYSFANTALTSLDLSNGALVAIGDYAFAQAPITYAKLPKSAQSIGIGSFYNCENLADVTLMASKIKIGMNAFGNCTALTTVNINAAVISAYSFQNCTSLKNVNLGKDVAVIGEMAFAGTSVAKFTINTRNTNLTANAEGTMLFRNDGKELVLVAPAYQATTITLDVTSIGTGAFAGNPRIRTINANNVVSVGSYAFAAATALKTVNMDNLQVVYDNAFYGCTNLETTPNLTKVTDIGENAFALTSIKEVSIAENTQVGASAFALNEKLVKVTIGNNVTLGERAFYLPVRMYTYESTGNTEVLQQLYTAYSYDVKDENGVVVATNNYYRYNFSAGTFSALTSLTIGNDVVIGDYAFYGNDKLTAVTLGDGAKIGAYAFYNNASLKQIDLSKVTYIGEGAFSGSTARDFWLTSQGWNYAYEMQSIEGQMVATAYVNSYFAPALENIDLTSTTYVGAGAFMGNKALKNVTLGTGVSEIAAYTFGNCSNLTAISLPENITAIGDYAFYGTGLNSVNLSNIDTVGAYAFAMTDVKEVVFNNNGVVIGEGAFEGCTELEKANIDAATYIGAYAFANSGIKTVFLTNAQYVGDYAFAESKIENLSFGKELLLLGENPFYGCNISTFGYTLFSSTTFGDFEELIETFDVSSTVKVIDGVLYQTVPNGLELVSYPMLKADMNYTVEEGTVRISARAFVGSQLRNVTLPSTLKSLGDKAFYGSANLSLVVFTSYNAPLLEEEYDESYISLDTLPYTGFVKDNQGNVHNGLGISPYYMWNATTAYNNFYFGATFVDYIGKISNSIVMVSPANGQNYDTFIFEQYFNTKVMGANAAMDATKAVIELINKLPASISLVDKAQVVAARQAYDKISALEQKALVSNYSVLQNAEATIEYLENRNNPNEDPKPGEEDPTRPPEEPETRLQVWQIILIVAGGVVVVGAIAVGVVIFLKKKKAN